MLQATRTLYFVVALHVYSILGGRLLCLFSRHIHHLLPNRVRFQLRQPLQTSQPCYGTYSHGWIQTPIFFSGSQHDPCHFGSSKYTSATSHHTHVSLLDSCQSDYVWTPQRHQNVFSQSSSELDWSPWTKILAALFLSMEFSANRLFFNSNVSRWLRNPIICCKLKKKYDD